MARMGFLDKAEELDVMIEAERAVLKKVRTGDQACEQNSFLVVRSRWISPLHQKRAVSGANLVR